MNVTIPMLLVSTVGFAPQRAVQETDLPKVGSRAPVDISVWGLGETSRRAPGDTARGGGPGLSGRSAIRIGFDCAGRIADQANPGDACLKAASTPTFGMLFPYPGINNLFVPPAFVGGGEDNRAIGRLSTVGGGQSNTASGYRATVGGGYANIASGNYATVGGGGKTYFIVFYSFGNTASGDIATVGGGAGNTASGSSATVGGGYSNTAFGGGSTVGGGRGNRANGGDSTVGGGFSNRAEGSGSTVGGGADNTAYGNDSTVGGGSTNTANGDYSTIGGGSLNGADGYHSTVAGGAFNAASGRHATVGGGRDNTTTGHYGTVGGGIFNSVSGDHATVPGGHYNTAQGDFSFAAGRRAKANHDGSFVWGDGFGVTDKPSSAADEFNVYASGGVRMFTNSAATTGVLLAAGGSTWTMVSDRDAKENVEPVDARAILDKVSQLPLATWNYKDQPDSIRHMGPMAQDFYGAFGLGLGETTIDTIDPNGVALAAIQGLNELVKDHEERLAAKNSEIEELRAANAALRQSDGELRRRVDRLEALARDAMAK